MVGLCSGCPPVRHLRKECASSTGNFHRIHSEPCREWSGCLRVVPVGARWHAAGALAGLATGHHVNLVHCDVSRPRDAAPSLKLEPEWPAAATHRHIRVVPAVALVTCKMKHPGSSGNLSNLDYAEGITW